MEERVGNGRRREKEGKARGNREEKRIGREGEGKREECRDKGWGRWGGGSMAGSLSVRTLKLKK